MSTETAHESVPSGREEDLAANQARLRAAAISIAVSIVLLGTKLYAFVLTGSTAVLSDALESIINVFAASIALGAIRLAHKPRDRNHPYGHGKIEFVSAAFEGGLITFAALLIAYQAVRSFWVGVELRELDLGLALVLGAGLVNAALGFYLLYAGRRYDSLALVADGRHVLADFWTSAAVVIALGLVRWTGIAWIDPTCAVAISIQLGWSGTRLVRQAVAGLLDEEDEETTESLVRTFDRHLSAGIIHVHSVRVMRVGRFHHIDAHVVVPEFWDIQTAHLRAEQYEHAVMAELGAEGEIEFHIEPCERLYCPRCPLEDCPVRRAPFEEQPPLTAEEIIRPDPQFPDRARGPNASTV